MDEAAARVTNVFGDMIDDLGDFVVQRVKDLPATIKQVSDTVSQAVNEGREQVSDGKHYLYRIVRLVIPLRFSSLQSCEVGSS